MRVAGFFFFFKFLFVSGRRRDGDGQINKRKMITSQLMTFFIIIRTKKDSLTAWNFLSTIVTYRTSDSVKKRRLMTFLLFICKWQKKMIADRKPGKSFLYFSLKYKIYNEKTFKQLSLLRHTNVSKKMYLIHQMVRS